MLALLAARPGPLRDALQTLLSMVPRIKAVHQVSDLLSTPRVTAEHRPALVLLAAGRASDGIPAIVKAIRENGLDSQCLVLVDDAQQQQQALAAGADAALLTGCRATELCKVIETLISGQQVGSESLH